MLNYVTNNHFREIESLPEIDGEILDFDNPLVTDDTEFAPCFKYKGEYYSLNEFMRCDEDSPFDGFMGFSYFSGLYIKLNESCDSLIVTYFYQ